MQEPNFCILIVRGGATLKSYKPPDLGRRFVDITQPVESWVRHRHSRFGWIDGTVWKILTVTWPCNISFYFPERAFFCVHTSAGTAVDVQVTLMHDTAVWWLPRPWWCGFSIFKIKEWKLKALWNQHKRDSKCTSSGSKISCRRFLPPAGLRQLHLLVSRTWHAYSPLYGAHWNGLGRDAFRKISIQTWT